MEVLSEFFTNEYILAPFLVWFFIQLFKVINDLRKYKRINPKRVLGAGGMPSSHSACVMTLTTMVGKNAGFDSYSFAISLIFSLVVMYDAAGVRRAAGKQAKVINKIINDPNFKNMNIQEKLGELLGHTPLEVFVGAVVGIIVGSIFG